MDFTTAEMERLSLVGLEEARQQGMFDLDQMQIRYSRPTASSHSSNETPAGRCRLIRQIFLGRNHE